MKDQIDDNTSLYVNRVLRIVGTLLLIAGGLYLLWKFSFIVVYMLIAAVLSFIGHPVVRLLDRIRIGKFRLPHGLSTFITLLLLVSSFICLLALFIPLIMQQAQTIASIDFNKVAMQLEQPFSKLQNTLSGTGLIPKGQTVQEFIAVNTKSLVSYTSFSNIFSSVIVTAGTILVSVFAIVFIAFFFLKDETMFEDIVLSLAPAKHIKAASNVLQESKELLKRYFIGVLFEILGGITLITIGLLILGVKNALLLGFFGGLMNIIPYIGPILGTLLGLFLGTTSLLAVGDFPQLLPMFFKIAGVFFTVHYLDSMLYQPLVYSKRIKAHPLEVFIVIIIGGSAYGILGMLTAMPVYTVLRVIAKEFFSKFRVVQKLTTDKNQKDN